MRIPKFSGTTGPCAKCGSCDAHIRYCNDDSCKVSYSHLDRICKCCGYKWEEACLETGEETVKRKHEWGSEYIEGGWAVRRCNVCNVVWVLNPDARYFEIDFECYGEVSG